MAYMGSQNSQSITYIFPTDYENISKRLSVNSSSVKPKKENVFFEVHPEYDIPYKLRCMILNSGSKLNFNTLETIKMIKHKGNTYWKDYMFQIPGIDKMLGIQRDYSVENHEKIERILQNPLLFLYLADARLNCFKMSNAVTGTLREAILDLVEVALDAYEKGEYSNGFNGEQIDICFRFLIEYYPDEHNEAELGIYEKPDIFSGWRLDSNPEKIYEYRKIELRLENVIDACAKNSEKLKSINRDNTCDNGRLLKFPKYIAPIICGFCKYQGILPFTEQKGKWGDTTLWRNHDIPSLYGVDEELKDTFYDIILYHIHKDIMKENAASLMSCREIKKTDDFLKQYYTFCIGTLDYIFSDEIEHPDYWPKYEKAALDSFERLFSLYLFKEETDLLYSKIIAAAGILGNSDPNDSFSNSEIEFELAKYMADFFTSDVLHEIFCSPGIYHRILLARYINDISISENKLAKIYKFSKIDELYIPYEETYFEEKKLREEIQNINRIYWYEEQTYILNNLFDDEEKLNLEKIENQCCKIPEYSKYNEFYKNIEKKITYRSGPTPRKRMTYVKHMAESILKEGKFKSPAYRFLHFWVIMSSFLPNHISFPALKYPLHSRQKP